MLYKEIQCWCNHRGGVGCHSDYHEKARSANAPNDINKNSSDIKPHFARALDNLIKSAIKTFHNSATFFDFVNWPRDILQKIV